MISKINQDFVTQSYGCADVMQSSTKRMDLKNIVDDAGAMIKRALPGSYLNPDKNRIENLLCFKIHSFTSKASAQ
jgi:hypothetical protein